MDWVQEKLHVGGRDTTCRLTMHIIHENACVFEVMQKKCLHLVTFLNQILGEVVGASKVLLPV